MRALEKRLAALEVRRLGRGLPGLSDRELAAAVRDAVDSLLIAEGDDLPSLTEGTCRKLGLAPKLEGRSIGDAWRAEVRGLHDIEAGGLVLDYADPRIAAAVPALEHGQRTG